MVSLGAKLKSATFTSVAELPLESSDPQRGAAASASAARLIARARAIALRGLWRLLRAAASLHGEGGRCRHACVGVVVVCQVDEQRVFPSRDVAVGDRGRGRGRVRALRSELDGGLSVRARVLREVVLAVVQREVQMALSLLRRLADVARRELEVSELDLGRDRGCDLRALLG